MVRRRTQGLCVHPVVIKTNYEIVCFDGYFFIFKNIFSCPFARKFKGNNAKLRAMTFKIKFSKFQIRKYGVPHHGICQED